MTKSELIKNTNNAFEFIEKLYLESTFLIKEVEGMLAREPEEFIIGKPRGYQISALNSNGIEPQYVPMWMTKRFGVFFVPKSMANTGARSQTVTPFDDTARVFYIRFLLHGKSLKEPEVWSGVMYGFKDKYNEKPRKFEETMTSYEQYEKTFFAGFPHVNYEDAYIKFKGDFVSSRLFDINNSDEVRSKVVDPALIKFRSVSQ